jgi:hypothetical protein
MDAAWAGVVSGIAIVIVGFGLGIQMQLTELKRSSRAIAATLIPIAKGLGHRAHLSELRRAAGLGPTLDDAPRRRADDEDDGA